MKRSLIRGVSWLSWNLGLDRLIDKMNRRRGGVLLAYHHISRGALERQLELLNRWYTFVSLSEFVQRHRQGQSTNGLLVITFDDGFALEVEAGAALAIQRGWPMTFYLPTRYVFSRQPYWFIRLASMIEAAPQGSYLLDDLSLRLDDGVSREGARRRVVRYLFGHPEAEIESFMERMAETLFQAQPDHVAIDVPNPIAVERVRILSREESIAFEAHSVNHPYFSILSSDEIRQEMEASRQTIAELTGKDVRHFCYPYGTMPSIGRQAPEIARSLFASATTAVRARCHSGMDRALLPRITMHEHYTTGMISLKVKATR